MILELRVVDLNLAICDNPDALLAVNTDVIRVAIDIDLLDWQVVSRGTRLKNSEIAIRSRHKIAVNIHDQPACPYVEGANRSGPCASAGREN